LQMEAHLLIQLVVGFGAREDRPGAQAENIKPSLRNHCTS